MKDFKGTKIIGIDHGYGNIKTAKRQDDYLKQLKAGKNVKIIIKNSPF